MLPRTHLGLPSLMLYVCLTTFYLLVGTLPVLAQDSQQIDENRTDLVATSNQKNKAQGTAIKKEIDINFLLNYYSQDGQHSAVTGGEGTEQLRDRALKIIVNVPLDSLNSLKISGHANVYTSASTDRIDTNVSSASRHDLRSQFDVDFRRKIPFKSQYYNISFGGSTESDYISVFAGLGWEKSFNNDNNQIGIGFKAFFDTWLLIFPEELRNTAATSSVTTNRRRSYNLSATYTAVINKKLQFGVFGDLVVQNGLLSTPFHRVFFEDENVARIEKLPKTRIKYPFGFRLNYFSTDFLVLRSYYRFYQDDFKITAHTFSVEAPVKLSSFFSVYPFYRYHKQSSSTFFAPIHQHTPTSEYYTSDYDLSGFNSRKIGIGLHFAPVWGLGRFKFLSKKKVTVFKSLDLRYAHYKRSDGLKATIISADFAFRAK